jgi:hypothetical protein
VGTPKLVEAHLETIELIVQYVQVCELSCRTSPKDLMRVQGKRPHDRAKLGGIERIFRRLRLAGSFKGVNHRGNRDWRSKRVMLSNGLVYGRGFFGKRLGQEAGRQSRAVYRLVPTLKDCAIPFLPLTLV